LKQQKEKPKAPETTEPEKKPEEAVAIEAAA
jgi:hypothetical protein